MIATPPAGYSALDRPDVLTALFSPAQIRRTQLMAVAACRIYGSRLTARFASVPGFTWPMPTVPAFSFFTATVKSHPITTTSDRCSTAWASTSWWWITAAYGCSDGSPTVSAMMADCRRIFDFTDTWKPKTGLPVR